MSKKIKKRLKSIESKLRTLTSGNVTHQGNAARGLVKNLIENLEYLLAEDGYYTKEEILAGAYDNLYALGDSAFPSDRWFNEYRTDDGDNDWWNKKVETTKAHALSVVTCTDAIRTQKFNPYPHNPFIEENESDDR